MIVTIGALSIILLAAILIATRKRKNTGLQIALMILIGAIGLAVLYFGVLIWGFRNFG